VEIGEQLSVKRENTLVKFIPYKPSDNYQLTENSELCPKFDGTDVRCLNEQDCQILESVGMPCFPADSRQIGVAPVNKNGEGDGPASYTYIVPIAIAFLIVIVIVFLLYRRRSRPIKVITRFHLADIIMLPAVLELTVLGRLEWLK